MNERNGPQLTATERAAVEETLGAIRDNLKEPARGIVQAILELVEKPGPTNNLAWALEAFREHAVEEWLRSEERVDEIANYLMDARMDGPWWKPPSTLTYQEAMRHYARGVLDELCRSVR